MGGARAFGMFGHAVETELELDGEGRGAEGRGRWMLRAAMSRRGWGGS